MTGWNVLNGKNIISLKYNGSDIDVERLRDKLREELNK